MLKISRNLTRPFRATDQDFFRNTTSSYTVASKDSSEDENVRPWKDIPGPTTLPLIGPLLHFLPGGSLNTKPPKKATRTIYDVYGPIVRFDAFNGFNPSLLIFDPEVADHIIRSEDRSKRPVRDAILSFDYIRGVIRQPGELNPLLTTKGDCWKFLRTSLNPVLLKSKLNTQVLDEISSEIVKRIKSFNKLDDNRIKIHFNDEVNLWTMEALCSLALGYRYEIFDTPEDSPEKIYLKEFKQLIPVLVRLHLTSNLWKHISTPTYKKALKNLAEVEKYILNKAKAELENAQRFPQNAKESSILMNLLAIDKNVALAMLSDLFFAGIDTNANAIMNTLYLLATNPEKQHKLREELKSDSSKVYLKACLKESLRIMPILSAVMRLTTREYNIKGYRVPKDILTVFLQSETCNMEKYFPRPAEYIPERWLVDKNDPLSYKNAHPLAYIPFGFGIRSCVGRRLVELQMQMIVSKIIENFHVNWNGPPPRVKIGISSRMQGPYNFVFTELH